MRIVILTISILSFFSSCGQLKNNAGNANTVDKKDSSNRGATDMSDYHPVFEKAHPKAKELLKDSFFFSSIEETAPFGSDDGTDAYAHFKDWRKINLTESPVNFIHSLISYWKYPEFDLEETDFDKLKPFIASDNLNIQIMTGIDQAVVATAFGQLYLEGKIDADIKTLAKTAVKRELLPQILKMWDKYAAEREQKLGKLLSVLNAPGI